MSDSRIDEVNQLIQGATGKAFPFENIGDEVSGVIVDMERRQQTDIETNELKFFPNGAPMYTVVLTLQTELQEDEGDDGLRTVWIKGGNYTPAKGKGASALTALKDAMRKVGATEIELNAHLTMTYTGDGTVKNRGYTAPKLYTDVYELPSKSMSVDDLG